MGCASAKYNAGQLSRRPSGAPQARPTAAYQPHRRWTARCAHTHAQRLHAAQLQRAREATAAPRAPRLPAAAAPSSHMHVAMHARIGFGMFVFGARPATGPPRQRSRTGLQNTATPPAGPGAHVRPAPRGAACSYKRHALSRRWRPAPPWTSGPRCQTPWGSSRTAGRRPPPCAPGRAASSAS